MTAVKRMVFGGLAIALGGLLASSTAWAVPVGILTEIVSTDPSNPGDRSGLTVKNDTVIWPLPLGTFVQSVLNPTTFPSLGGFDVTVFREAPSPVFTSESCEDLNPAGCDFQIRQQPESFDGNFANGDHVLENLTTTDFDDSIQIEFSKPVLGAGAQLQLISTSPSVPFVGRVRVYSTQFSEGSGEGAAGFLGGFTLDGLSCPITQTSCLPAIFMGFSDTVPEIKRIEFNVLQAGAEAQFGINQLDIGVRTTAVPEPGSFLLLTVGVLALGYGRRRSSR